MTNLDSIFKSRDITLPTKVCLVKTMPFPVVTYGYENWTEKKAERRRIDAFELWQQLAQQSWLRTNDVCTIEIVRAAHAALVEQLSLLFVTITETLTTQQLNYLKALIAGEKAISSTDVMHRYQISSPTSVARSKAALIKNDILDNKAGEISFQDPIYAYWLKNEYFAK